MREPIDDLGIAGVTTAVEIGSGGFGVVYRAIEEDLGRTVAVKVLSGNLDEAARYRFERERRAMGRLSGHPNIVTIYRGGYTTAGNAFLVMEYLDRGSLADRLVTVGPVGWQEALKFTIQLSGALETSHRAGVLHRDIKPGNILLSSLGNAKLCDFGIARLQGAPETKSSVITASLSHAPPDIVSGSRPDARSDVYSLASTLFELVTASPPFVRPTDESMVPILARIANDPVPELSETVMPGPVFTVVEQAMSKEPDDRPQTAAEFAELLVQAQRQLGLPSTPIPIEAVEPGGDGATGGYVPFPDTGSGPLPAPSASSPASPPTPRTSGPTTSGPTPPLPTDLPTGAPPEGSDAAATIVSQPVASGHDGAGTAERAAWAPPSVGASGHVADPTQVSGPIGTPADATHVSGPVTPADATQVSARFDSPPTPPDPPGAGPAPAGTARGGPAAPDAGAASVGAATSGPVGPTAAAASATSGEIADWAAPAAEPSETSGRPGWLVPAVVATAVVILGAIGLAVALSGDGDDTAGGEVGATGADGVDDAAVDDSEALDGDTEATADGYSQYVELRDTTGTIQINVPVEWQDKIPAVGGTPERPVASLVAGPDLDGYFNRYDEPGVSVAVATGGIGADYNDALDVYVDPSCTPSPEGRVEISSPYVGRTETFTDCGGTGTSLMHSVFTTGDLIAVVRIQMVSDADRAAAETIQSSLRLQDLVPEPAESGG